MCKIIETKRHNVNFGNLLNSGYFVLILFDTVLRDFIIKKNLGFDRVDILLIVARNLAIPITTLELCIKKIIQ